jgi:hypothetical protein
MLISMQNVRAGLPGKHHTIGTQSPCSRHLRKTFMPLSTLNIL